MSSSSSILNKINSELKAAIKSPIPVFRTGDTVRVHAKIVEGQKERIQIFEGLVVKSSNGRNANGTFTVRKISFNVGVERTFYLHSPRIDKIELVATGSVRRARLFYLRPLRGKAARIKSKLNETSSTVEVASEDTSVTADTSQPAA